MTPFLFYLSFITLPPHHNRLSCSLILILLLSSGIHPNPGPSDPNFKFLQMNINGIQNSRFELLDFLNTHSIKVACIQESKLTARLKAPSFPGYALVSWGGLVILIYHLVPFLNINTSSLTACDQSLEVLAVQIDIGLSKLDIFNIYLPPISSCPVGHRPDFATLLDFPG
jgi:exonuclease III